MTRTLATPLHLPVLALIALLGACAAPGDFPSLARRDAERITEAPAAAPEEPPAPATPGLDARLARLTEQARAAHARFTSRRPAAEARIAAGAGAAVGGEAWAVATVALADLEAARSEAMVALAELDALHAADRIANPNQPSADAAAIASARDQVMAWIAEEDRVFAMLHARIR